MKLPFFPKLPLLIAVIALLIGFGMAGYFFYQYQKIQQQLKNPALFTQEETRKIIERVGKLIEVPEDEEPKVATVSDPERLKDQPFFAKAKTGNKLLIYNNAKKAILYDPVANKIIDVAPINVATDSAATQTTTTPSLSPASSFKLFLLNGTTTTGLTKKYEEALKRVVPKAVVIDRDNAKKQDYQKTILVDLSGTKREESRQLATTLGIDVGNLPSGEPKPEGADFLIIVGADKN